MHRLLMTEKNLFVVLSKNTNGNIVRQITVQSQRSMTIFRVLSKNTNEEFVRRNTIQSQRVLSKNTNENIARRITVQSQRSVTIFRPRLGPDFQNRMRLRLRIHTRPNPSCVTVLAGGIPFLVAFPGWTAGAQSLEKCQKSARGLAGCSEGGEK